MIEQKLSCFMMYKIKERKPQSNNNKILTRYIINQI
jgi:hypothetical protein